MIPGRCTICAWSPRLDVAGNSVAAVAALDTFTTLTGSRRRWTTGAAGVPVRPGIAVFVVAADHALSSKPAVSNPNGYLLALMFSTGAA